MAEFCPPCCKSALQWKQNVTYFIDSQPKINKHLSAGCFAQNVANEVVVVGVLTNICLSI